MIAVITAVIVIVVIIIIIIIIFIIIIIGAWVQNFRLNCVRFGLSCVRLTVVVGVQKTLLVLIARVQTSQPFLLLEPWRNSRYFSGANLIPWVRGT